MSGYTNPHLRRSDGISSRGVFITLGVVLVVFVLLAALGAGTVQDGTPRAVAPEAAESDSAASAAPASD